MLKKGYTLPRPIMANSDLTRLINSDEIQSVVRAPKTGMTGRPLKKNPLKNLSALLRLNPYAKVQRRAILRDSVRAFCQHRLIVVVCGDGGFLLFCRINQAVLWS